MPHLGLALATSISGWINATYLFVKLRNTKEFTLHQDMKSQIIKIVICSIIMFFTILTLDVLEINKYFKLFILVAIGIVIYFTFAKIMKIEIFSFLIRKITKRA